jgi:hypothetical protein
MNRTMTTVAIGVLLLATACGGDEETPRADARPASTAKLQILEPKPGGQMPVDAPIVKLQLDGATVLDEPSATITPDTGHIHIKLDSKTISLLAGLEANLNDLLAEVKEPPLTKGQHLLEVEFVAADHGFFDPRVVVTTPFVAV